MGKFLAQVILTIIAVLFTPPIYTAGAGITGYILRLFDLAAYNAENWIGVSAGGLTSCLFLYGLLQVSQASAIGFRMPLHYRLLRVLNKLWSSLALVGLAIAAWVTSFILAVYLIPGMTLQSAFLLSIIVAGTIVAVLIEAQKTVWDQVLEGIKINFLPVFDRPDPEGLIPWGRRFVKKQNEPLHFAVCGNTGAGKSTVLEILMSTALAAIGINQDARGIVFDAKRDMASFLAALEVPYKVLNPLDQECVAWEIGRDIQGEGMAMELAVMLLEPLQGGGPSGENKYFYDAAKLAITAAIVCLQKRRGYEWTLRDLINAFSTKEDFAELLRETHPRPKEFDEFLKGKKGEKNEVLTTVKATLQQYSVVAARWEKAKAKFNWDDWAKEEYILLFGSDHTYGDLIKKTNSLLFLFGAKKINSLPENSNRRIWIVVDEAVASGRLIELDKVLALGRSAGVCVVVAFQNIAGFIQEYGEKQFKSIFGLCRHKAFLGMDGYSAQIISEYIGKYRYLEYSESHGQTQGFNQSSTSFTQSWRVAERNTISPQSLSDLVIPQTGPENGLTGYFAGPDNNIHLCHYSWAEVQSMRVQRVEGVENYSRVDDEDPSLSLTPWTNQERQQLGLSLISN